MERTKVLIADDDESILWVLERFFGEKGIETVRAADGLAAKKILSEDSGIKLAVLDIKMPGAEGLEILREAKALRSPASFIIMTADSTMENTLEAMKLGAFDYISKPFDLGELDIIVSRALEDIELRKKVTDLKERLKEISGEVTFVGKSKALEKVFKAVGKISPTDVTVLILGESGTGKELLARLLHTNSLRTEGPFVAVNSAAVPRELMESELFGFEKGAFTGAAEARKGKFELADGGTLFLDEVGDMSLELQARLLRVLQEKEFFRIGGKEPVRVDVRIIAATNQDLDTAVKEKRFREDLLFRLNGVILKLPPLRERGKGDIEILSKYFLEKFSATFGVEVKTLSHEALEALKNYHWPGNVRELESALMRAVVLSSGLVITPEDLNLPQSKQKKESLEEIIAGKLKPFVEKTDKGKQDLYELIIPIMERPLIRLVLEKTRGNQVQAAELLGINRNTLRKKIRKLKINVETIKE